jgi:hypothetical protein
MHVSKVARVGPGSDGQGMRPSSRSLAPGDMIALAQLLDLMDSPDNWVAGLAVREIEARGLRAPPCKPADHVAPAEMRMNRGGAMPDPCKLCGVDMDKWGRMHTCNPRQQVSVERLANNNRGDVANADSVANDMANTSATTLGRNRASPTYRYRNPDKRRTYMADYMRTYRKRVTEKNTATTPA